MRYPARCRFATGRPPRNRYRIRRGWYRRSSRCQRHPVRSRRHTHFHCRQGAEGKPLRRLFAGICGQVTGAASTASISRARRCTTQRCQVRPLPRPANQSSPLGSRHLNQAASYGRWSTIHGSQVSNSSRTRKQGSAGIGCNCLRPEASTESAWLAEVPPARRISVLLHRTKRKEIPLCENLD